MQTTKFNKKGIARQYLKPAFLICVVVLATAASGMSIAIKKFGVYLQKEPLPPKKPLALLDEKTLDPFKVVSKKKIDDDEIIEQLGTEDYIQWVLEDIDAEADNAVRFCTLFVTYYELPDKVPHVPDECYVGAGNQRLGADDIVFKVNKNGIEEELAGRYVVFTPPVANSWVSDTKFAVLYIFRVNGEYTGNRSETRIILNKNIRRKNSYFSKVELGHFLTKSGAPVRLSKEETIAVAEKVWSKLLPVLENEHWPDW